MEGIDISDRTKFNVDMEKSDRTYNGITFDSKLEMQFYRDIVLPKFESGEIKEYELQKKYELQPKFSYNGNTIREINYVADFYIIYSDGHEEVIDTKGMADSAAKIKKKLFMYRYPDIEYHWMSYCKKWGGWIEYEELQRLRTNAKRKKKKGELKNGEKE